MHKHHVILLAILFTFISVIARLTPHPWNFVPMGSLMLFSGFFLPRRWMWLPMAGLVVSDMTLGTYQWQVMFAVYGCYAVMVSASFILKGRYSFNTALGASVGAAVFFFLVTNAAHWLWFGGYTMDIQGLMAAYTAGIPFFRNSFLGYVVYSAVFFGAYEFACRFSENKISDRLFPW